MERMPGRCEYSLNLFVLQVHCAEMLPEHCEYSVNLFFSSHRYTTRTGSLNTVYALVLKWPTGQLHLGAPVPTRTTSVTLLGYAQPLAWTVSDVGGVVISIPQLSVREIPCLWAWVFQLTNIS